MEHSSATFIEGHTMKLEAGSVIKPTRFALLVIVIALTAVYECGAQNTPPATAPVAPQVQAPAAAPANAAAAAAAGGAGQRCVQHTPNGNKIAKEIALNEVNVELRSTPRATGSDLVSASYFMPAGASSKVAINEPLNPTQRYFGYVQRFIPHDDHRYTTYVNMDGFIESGAIGAVRIPDNDALVKGNDRSGFYFAHVTGAGFYRRILGAGRAVRLDMHGRHRRLQIRYDDPRGIMVRSPVSSSGRWCWCSMSWRRSPPGGPMSGPAFPWFGISIRST